MNEKKITRRAFVEALGVGAAGVAMSAVLAACSSSAESAASSSAARSAPTAQSASSAAASRSTASGAAQSASQSKSASPQAVTVPEDARVLVAYFSRPGMNNDGNGGYADLDVGYTATVAGYMADELGCPTFEIQAADPYPHDYSETVRRNVVEEQAGTLPDIANLADLPSIDDYDVIIMGSPVWNSQSPMIMRTFLASYDFTGKIILPFTTYDMSRLGSVPNDYAKAAPTALVSDAGLAVYEADAKTEAGRQYALAWLDRMGLR